jgi:hypothetical protein
MPAEVVLGAAGSTSITNTCAKAARTSLVDKGGGGGVIKSPSPIACSRVFPLFRRISRSSIETAPTDAERKRSERRNGNIRIPAPKERGGSGMAKLKTK